jgi:hypothetical protein
MEFLLFSDLFLYTKAITRVLETNNAIIKGPESCFLVNNYQNALLSLKTLRYLTAVLTCSTLWSEIRTLHESDRDRGEGSNKDSLT